MSTILAWNTAAFGKCDWNIVVACEKCVPQSSGELSQMLEMYVSVLGILEHLMSVSGMMMLLMRLSKKLEFLVSVSHAGAPGKCT